jgi:hypothetical protein
MQMQCPPGGGDGRPSADAVAACETGGAAGGSCSRRIRPGAPPGAGVISTMEQSDAGQIAPRPRKPPTAGSWKPGQSGNPKGRPRKGDALAEAIRAQVSPEELIAVARGVIDSDAPPSVKLQAAQFLAERGYRRPAETLELARADAEVVRRCGIRPVADGLTRIDA